MNVFWENITRYPRFLITSVSGLIVVLLSPLLKIGKKNLMSQIFVVSILILTLVFFSLIIISMLNI
jgi:heme O synthase-like polyprenyltransferase